jgi:hypothetical protein
MTSINYVLVFLLSWQLVSKVAFTSHVDRFQHDKDAENRSNYRSGRLRVIEIEALYGNIIQRIEPEEYLHLEMEG